MKTLVAAAALALGISTASAADFPYKAPQATAMAATAYNWTGFYIGAVGSYNWQKFGFEDPDVTGLNAKGLMGGVTTGYDYQTGALVIGAVGDVVFGNNGVTVKNGNYMTESATERLAATMRGRVGVLVHPSLLLYGTAGVMIASVDHNETCPDGAPFGFCAAKKAGPYSLTGNLLYFGGVYGAGAEWMFAKGWTTKVEYLWADLGTGRFNLGNAPTGMATNPRDLSLTQQQVRFGVNYRF